MSEQQLYFRQLLSGRDVGTEDQVARQMMNFIYLIGDRATGEAVVIDPAYDPQGIINIFEEDEMTLPGVLATHYHPIMWWDMMGLAFQESLIF
ncbi:MAG: hypothetical protein CM15mP49_35560 [Actinomycetota bacterium]|nr:MAG: hypothetical protein CM15mP49_35560 [Actinomycetota bacterium]